MARPVLCLTREGIQFLSLYFQSIQVLCRSKVSGSLCYAKRVACASHTTVDDWLRNVIEDRGHRRGRRTVKRESPSGTGTNEQVASEEASSHDNTSYLLLILSCLLVLLFLARPFAIIAWTFVYTPLGQL